MKSVRVFLVIFLGIVHSGNSQDLAVDLDNLLFESETEQKIWKSSSSDPFQYFTALDAASLSTNSKWVGLLNELDAKANKTTDQLSLVRTIFQMGHHRIFKKYEQHSTFNALLRQGNNDCVC